MKDLFLDHIAIAARSLEDTVKVYEDIGFVFDEKREVVEDQKVRTAFATIDQRAHVEILEPTDETSPIAKFIDKRGEGIHHMCFRVDDVRSKQSELTAKGYQFIYEQPVIGAGNCLVNFIHPKSAKGVLIELSQKN